MKGKNINLLVLAILLITGFIAAIFASNNLAENDDVTLRVETDKNNISLGEPVNLELEFTNEGNTAVQIPDGGVMGGNIVILIAKKGESFRKYFRADWGRIDGEADVVMLKPNQKHKVDNTNATILWNGKPDYSHLNPEAAKRMDAQDNRILTDYAFPDSGTYLIKAVSCLLDNSNGCSIPIESEPIEIVVNKPIGEDLQVWNQIKGNRAIAMLMQAGTFYKSKEDEKAQVVSQLEQIIERYPNSTYSGYLKPNLEKFRNREAKRDEFYKNVKKSNKPQ